MSAHSDIIVIGGGIVGISHAVAALRQGLKVLLIERDETPRGASVRNFGTIWPIGQPQGHGRELAERSRKLWLDWHEDAAVTVRACGSLHLAREADELRVLKEFYEREHIARELRLLTPEEASEFAPAVRTEGLMGALWSASELGVDPGQAISALHRFVSRSGGAIGRGVAVGVEGGCVRMADGSSHDADHVFVCSGDDLATLCPAELSRLPLTLCRLQMMRTYPQPASFRLGPHIAGGLTLCHYPAFSTCASLEALRDRFDRERPEYRAAGIHVLATQHATGEIVIGDSHHYGSQANTPRIDSAVNALILRYLDELVKLPDRVIESTWNGVYAKTTDGSLYFAHDAGERCTLVSGLGGAGMTLAPALGEHLIGRIASGGATMIRPDTDPTPRAEQSA